VKLALETGQDSIPVEYVDLSEEEEAEALATLDPLAALAEIDKPKLDALLQQVRTASPAVQGMLRQLAQTGGIKEAREPSLKLPPEKFEVVVECTGEARQRELFDRLTGEGLKCRVLTF
jgi:hypothetical protein